MLPDRGDILFRRCGYHKVESYRGKVTANKLVPGSSQLLYMSPKVHYHFNYDVTAVLPGFWFEQLANDHVSLPEVLSPKSALWREALFKSTESSVEAIFDNDGFKVKRRRPCPSEARLRVYRDS